MIFKVLLSLITYSSVHTVSTLELKWLNGFQNCSNTIVLLQNTCDAVSYTPSVKWITVTLLTNTDLVERVPIKFTKWSSCRTFSVVFESESTAVQVALNTLIGNASLITPTVKTVYQTLVSSFQRYLFVVPLNKPIRSVGILKSVLQSLSSNVYDSEDFIINMKHNDQFQLTYVCTACRSHDPLLVHFNCSTRDLGCYNEIHNTASSVKGNGKKLLWTVPSIFKFRVDSSRLDSIGSGSLRNILNGKPHLDEVILATLIHNIKYKVKYHHGGSSWTSNPWVLVNQGLFRGYCNIPTRLDGYNFITCDGSAFKISFGAYAKPFSKEVWIGLIMSLAGSTILMVITAYLLNHPGLTLASVFFTKYALLMETDVFMGKMSRDKKYRMFLGIWLFGTLILSTAYKGDNIASVIVPNEQDKTYKFFTQLGNFTLFTPSLFGVNVPDEQASNTHFGFSFGMWLKDTAGFGSSNPLRKFEISDEEIMSQRNVSDEDKRIAKLYKNIKVIQVNEQEDLVQKVFSVLGKCDRTAFVADLTQTFAVLKRLKGNSRSFYSGDKSLFETVNSWMFSLNGGSYMPRRLNRLIASGIFEMWKVLLGNSDNRGGDGSSTNSDQLKPLSMNSNLRSIFYIFALGSAFTVVEFILEVFVNRKSSYRMF